MTVQRRVLDIWKDPKSMTKILPALADHLVQLSSATEHGVVVDMACGVGTCARRFAPNAKKVYALDVSKEQVRACRGANNKFANIEVMLQDVQRPWPIKNRTVDMVTGVGALSNLDQPATALREASRVLKPHGQLLLGDFCIPSAIHEVWGALSSMRYGSRRPYVDYHQYMDLLLDAGFEVVQYRAIRWRYCLNDTLTKLSRELAHASIKAVRDLDRETQTLLHMQVQGKRVILEHDCFALSAGRIGATPNARVDDMKR